MSSTRILADLLGLVWPVACAGCTRAGAAFCGDCAQAFEARPVRVSLSGWPAAPPAWACAPYRGEVAAAVVAWKDRGRHDLTAVLGSALARAVLAVLDELAGPGAGPLPGTSGGRSDGRSDAGSGGGSGGSSGGAGGAVGGPLLLVPVPSRRSARRRRGQDVGRSLAGCAASQVRAAPAGRAGRSGPGPAVRVVPALRLPAGVRDQAGLGAAERAANLAGATRLRRGAAPLVAGRRCLVVDDVLTTGASARAAAAALEAAGASVVGLAAACATPLRRGLLGEARWD